MMRLLVIGTTIALLTLVGCATAPVEQAPLPRIDTVPAQSPAALSRTRAAVVRTAAKLVGATTLQSNGRQIAYDCAGVTRAIFLEHGIDLYHGSPADSNANGVRLIFAHVRRHGTVHQSPVPQPGDLVFFDNTWDFNGDGRLNDPLTHVGVVERVDPDGTVIFISRVADAIERHHMNLALPHVHKTADGRVLNDYIRRKRPGDPDDMGHLTGELFTFYGTRLGQ
ncbi:MAG TPA: CHAP domain-containing protein [Nitrospira sp.]|nr:CHAP domain-containing protein [Nitrospira sp.]